MRTPKSVAFSMLGLLWTAKAEAHIQLQTPPARYVQDNNGLKNAPCGSGTRSGVVTKVTAGQSLTVTWKESVSHAGHYRIALSAQESDFVDPSSLAIPNPLPAWDLSDGIPDKTGTQTYSQTVQLPSTECPACVLQLIQVMSAGSDGTNTGSFSGVYHACADLAITGAGGGGGSLPDASSAVDARTDMSTRDLHGTGGVAADALGAAGGMMGSAGGAYAGTGGGAPASNAGGSTGRGGSPGGMGGDLDARAAGVAGQPGTGGWPVAGSGGAAAAGSSGMGGTSGAGGAETGGIAAGGSRSGLDRHGGDTAGASAGSGGGGTGGGESSTSAAGCSCRLARPSTPKSSWLWFALTAVWLGRRRNAASRR